MTARARRRGLALVAGVLLAATMACGNDNSDAYAKLTDARADRSVSGEVTVTGSSTVEPVSANAAQAFGGQNERVDVSVDGPGTGDGFQRFCAGDADLTGASRPIEPDEVEACRRAGIDVVELPVGLDGIAVVVPASSSVRCLSFADLYALIGPEATGSDRWRDASGLARELGSDTRFPDENLVLTGPGEESGTYDSFVEQVIDPVAEERVADGAVTAEEAEGPRPDYSSSANDNTVVEGVASDPGGIGWVGYAFAGSDDVRRVAVAAEPAGPCVAPSADTIRDGSYPISRTLYVYVNADRAAERPVVAAFVDFYLAGLDDFIRLSDYVTLADPAATVARWEARTTGPSAEDDEG